MELPTGNERYFRMSVEEFDTEKLMQNAARQRDQRKFNDMLIIDVDAHHYETESMKEIVEFIEDPVLRQLARSAQQIARPVHFPRRRNTCCQSINSSSHSSWGLILEPDNTQPRAVRSLSEKSNNAVFGVFCNSPVASLCK